MKHAKNFLSRRSLFALVWTAVGLAACTGSLKPGTGGEPQLHVESDRPSAQVTVSYEENRAIVDVHSDNGIGRATVKLVSGKWPHSILMRFHLQGLENLQFSYDETAVVLSINTQNMILQSVSTSGEDQQMIDEGSGYWMPVTFVDRGGSPADSPSAGGVIEVGIPPNFLAGAYNEFTINWIDFYR